MSRRLDNIGKSLVGREPNKIVCPKCDYRFEHRGANLVELFLVLFFCMIPTFILASEVDGDEFAKATSGAILAGIVLAAYRVFKGATAKED